MVVTCMKTSEAIDADKALINFVLGKDMVVFMEMLHHSNSTFMEPCDPYSRHQTLFILVWRAPSSCARGRSIMGSTCTQPDL